MVRAGEKLHHTSERWATSMASAVRFCNKIFIFAVSLFDQYVFIIFYVSHLNILDIHSCRMVLGAMAMTVLDSKKSVKEDLKAKDLFDSMREVKGHYEHI